jgi:hypothetical protein
MSETYRVKTAHGTVHSMTDGRKFTNGGLKVANSRSRVQGKADCGSLTSSAASFTDEPVNCAKCLSR